MGQGPCGEMMAQGGLRGQWVPLSLSHTHTGSCHLPRSDGGEAGNLRPGCPRGGCEIPQVSAEIGHQGLMSWYALEETHQVRTGVWADDLGARQGAWGLGIWVRLLRYLPPGALCEQGRHLQVTLLLGSTSSPPSQSPQWPHPDGRAPCSSQSTRASFWLNQAASLLCDLRWFALGHDFVLNSENTCWPFASLPALPKELV